VLAFSLAALLSSRLGAQAPPDPVAEQVRLLLAMDDAGRAAWAAAHATELEPALILALLEQGGHLRDQNRLDSAVSAFEFARGLADRLADPRLSGRSRTSLAQVLAAYGRYDESLVQIRAARQLYAAAGETELEIRTITNLGIVARLQGDLDGALAHYADARGRAEGIGAQRLVAVALNNEAVVHINRGDLRLALLALERALALQGGQQDQLTADIVANLGEVHVNQGSLELATELLTRSIELQLSLGNIPGSLHERINLGGAYLYLERYEEADRVLAEAARLAEQGGLKDLASRARIRWGRSLASQGLLDAAAVQIAAGLEWARAANTPDVLVFALVYTAQIERLRGQPQAALQAAEEALGLAEPLRSSSRLAPVLTERGEALLLLGRPDEAAADFERAIALTEGEREQVAGGAIERQRFLESRLAPYERLLELHAAQGRPELAFAVAERAKARVLVEALSQGRSRLETLLAPDQREREQALRSALARANVELQQARAEAAPDSALIASREQRLREARHEHEAFRAAAFAADASIRARRGDIAPLASQEALKLLDERTLAAEYAVTERGTYLFTLDRRHGLRMHTLALSAATLARRTRAFRGRMAARDLAVGRDARELCQSLLGPARATLSPGQSLLIVPDGPLWELPFQALRCTPDRYLLEERAVAYAPSLTALREMARRRTDRRASTLLAVGDPALSGGPVPQGRSALRSASYDALPQARREVRELGKLYGPASAVYVGDEASEARVKAQAGGRSVLHFAAHGLLDDASPLYSQLVLAPPRPGESDDGLLEAQEIMELDLAADLAVLSACETGRGRVGRGEGLIGLSWAFFVAGCPTTVVSQWKVDSESTSQLMLGLHRGLARGRSTPEALRQAALRLLRDPRYRHPFYWAPFIVMGSSARSTR